MFTSIVSERTIIIVYGTVHVVVVKYVVIDKSLLWSAHVQYVLNRAEADRVGMLGRIPYGMKFLRVLIFEIFEIFDF